LPFDVELGRKLLAEAGYPGGRGFPKLSAIIHSAFFQNYNEELSRQWREHLGIKIDFRAADSWETDDWTDKHLTSPLVIAGWVADYPDPDNFLRGPGIIKSLRCLGWQDAEYDQLVEQAARTRDRAKRMAMYRQADRLLVAEQALALPIAYGSNQQIRVIKPWVKNFEPNLIDRLYVQNLIMEEH
jgi:oligopeptide transport system substrate-binding protein